MLRPQFAIQTCEALLADWHASAGPHNQPADERQRADAIASLTRRRQFLAGRWLAKVLLHSATGLPPVEWRISADAQAKPHVLGSDQLHLSISHSGDYVACALAGEAVGIDLESRHRLRPVHDMALWACSTQEQRALREVSLEQAQIPFNRMWTRKEARLKQRGLPFDLAALQATETIPVDDATADVGTWCFAQLGLVVSVAAQGLQQLHTQWPPHWRAEPVQWHRYV